MKHLIIAIIAFAFSCNLYSQAITNPRTPAEFEEVKGVLVSWDESEYLTILRIVEDFGSWIPELRDRYDGEMNTQATIIREVLNEGLEVYVTDDTSHNEPVVGKYFSDYHVADTLQALGIQSPNLHIIYSNGQLTTTPWARDWGPYTVYQNDDETAYMAGNPSTELLANYLNRPFIPITEIMMEGGNFMTNGHGSLFLSSLQPEIDLNLFGITDYIQAAEYKVHIDYWMKMIDEETFFVNDIPYENYDEAVDHWYGDNSLINQAISIIQQKSSCYGRPYKFVKIRTAPTYNTYSMTYVTSEVGYTNSLIINKTVLVPQYDNLETDTAALNTYRQYMPGYRIVGVPAKYFASRGGEIHCITKEIAADDPLRISHAWLSGTLPALPSYEITASINAQAGIEHAELYWSTNPNAGFQSISMNHTNGDTFVASIPGQPAGTHVSYYISATANGGKTRTKPYVAPDGYYSFFVQGTTGIAQVLSSSKDFTLSQNYPNPFNSNTNIEFELPTESFVTLKVYNVFGQEVATLVNEQRAAGRYNVELDGSSLTSGTYYYRLVSGGSVKSNIAVLLK